MSKQYDFESDLDAILAEFSDYSSQISSDTKPEERLSPAADKGTERTAPKGEEPEPGGTQEAAEYYVDMRLLTDYLENRQKMPEQTAHTPAAARPQVTAKPPRQEESFTPDFKPSGRAYKKPKWVKKTQIKSNYPQEKDPERVFSGEDRKKAAQLQQRAAEKQARREQERNILWENRQEEERIHQEVSERRQRMDSPFKTALAVVLGFVGVLVLGWTAANVHPDSGVSTATAVESRLHLAQGLDAYVNNAYADALGDLTYIKKIYTVPESASAGPRANPACFGETADPAVVQAVIDGAAELLDGQKTLWNPNISFYPGTKIQYYRDHSILVITWKEVYDERCCTMSEVKIAHGSQFRRRLAGDSYGSSVQLYASEMAKASNAIVASNADFYSFRPMGITVYQRQLFRADPGQLDTCFITGSGDMLFSRAGQLTDPEQIQRYIQENDVLFSLSFGPVLVDNGELQVCESYPIGEIDTQYSRAGLGMLDELHYLLMTVNHTDMRPRAKVNEFGRYMYEKGCIKAFNLDGGQTSEIVMNGTPVNYIDFGAERTVSDIIYFATAIPESEWGGGTGAAP